jgi:hypothetical protein
MNLSSTRLLIQYPSVKYHLITETLLGTPYFFIFLTVLWFEIRALNYQGRCSTT